MLLGSLTQENCCEDPVGGTPSPWLACPLAVRGRPLEHSAETRHRNCNWLRPTRTDVPPGGSLLSSHAELSTTNQTIEDLKASSPEQATVIAKSFELRETSGCPPTYGSEEKK